MQAKSFFGTGMWSGADVCPASYSDFNTSRGPYGIRGSDPIRFGVLEALINLLVLLILFSDRLPIILC